VIVGVLSFIYLNSAFEGPSVLKSVGDPYEVKATFDDVENLPTKSAVLVNGVDVGKVTEVSYNSDDVTGTVTFTIDEEYTPVHADATARIGERTILGDPYLDLDLGNEAAGDLEAGHEIAALPSVDFDEAFDFLDADGRAHLQSLLRTFSDGLSAEGNGARLNGTIGGLARTTEELNVLTQTLEGQEDEIAGIVSGSATVLGELGSRESALRSIVGSGRVTLDALAANTTSLERGIHELPPLLAAAESSLVGARPLLAEARPFVAKLRAIAPDLRPVLAQIGPVARDASRLIAALKPFRVAAAPALRITRELLVEAGPLVKKLIPGIRNLVAISQYIAPRSESIAAFFANIASALQSGDSNGKWLRFALQIEPGEVADLPTPSVCEPEDDIPVNVGLCQNAYPFPGDAVDPEPYVPGSYTRVQPFTPPPRPATP
jgi:phospholipid/cholesterol/gamma-HCH transport system substrate-binding protein